MKKTTATSPGWIGDAEASRTLGVTRPTLYAYGPQADFSYPERPARAAASWQPEWVARVRFRANAMVIHGMPGMGGFSGGEEEAGEQPAQPELPRCRGLSGIAKRAAGLCQ